VELIEPLGYSTEQNQVSVVLPWDEMVTIDFQLEQIAVTDEARSKGYWKHQVKANLSGRGNYDYDEGELLGFTQAIFDYFYENAVNPIVIDRVTFIGNPASALGMSDLDEVLNINQGGSTMQERAYQQFVTLLLNVVSFKLSQEMQASDDGAIVSQAIIYVNELLQLGTNDEMAKDISETLNQGQTVAAGLIPLDTPYMLFNEGLASVIQLHSFKLKLPVPNPFNASTAIRYQVSELCHVNLEVCDISGRKVTELVNDWRDAGSHEITFDASNLPSGVYFARLTAGNIQQTQKLLLIK
jgi:hypothetical protein